MISYCLPSSHLSPAHPLGQEQLPGRTQCPPFKQPSGGKQIAEVDNDQFIELLGKKLVTNVVNKLSRSNQCDRGTSLRSSSLHVHRVVCRFLYSTWSTYNRIEILQLQVCLRSSHRTPSHPIPQEQWPGRTHTPPFRHPSGGKHTAVENSGLV